MDPEHPGLAPSSAGDGSRGGGDLAGEVRTTVGRTLASGIVCAAADLCRTLELASEAGGHLCPVTNVGGGGLAGCVTD